MHMCIIMHNMIVKDEEEEVKNWEDDDGASTLNGGFQAH